MVLAKRFQAPVMPARSLMRNQAPVPLSSVPRLPSALFDRRNDLSRLEYRSPTGRLWLAKAVSAPDQCRSSLVRMPFIGTLNFPTHWNLREKVKSRPKVSSYVVICRHFTVVLSFPCRPATRTNREHIAPAMMQSRNAGAGQCLSLKLRLPFSGKGCASWLAGRRPSSRQSRPNSKADR